jgi:paraquat-inducible protein B
LAGYETHRWKLGLFVLLGLATCFGALIALGASRFDTNTQSFVTYFDESVQGLEEGSPVKFRGVKIGSVSRITVAPDRRRVEVLCAVNVGVLERLGLRAEGGDPEPDTEFVPPDLRIQLASAGLATGSKFLQADFFDPRVHPPPGLPFPTPANYIPATESTSIEESLVHGLNDFPGLVASVRRTVDRVDRMVADLEKASFAQRTGAALEQAERTLAKAETKLDELDAAGLSDATARALQRAEAGLARVERLLDRVEGEGGILADLEHTTEELRAAQLGRAVARVDAAALAVEEAAGAVAEVAGGDTARELDDGLRALREASHAVRRLADALERDADMLLKGRAKEGR